MDITLLSIPELQKLNTQVAQELKSRQDADIARAREQILQIAKNAGLSLKDLLKPLLHASSKKLAVKYRDPANSTQQWTGRGRMPRWAKALQDAGQLEQARIK